MVAVLELKGSCTLLSSHGADVRSETELASATITSMLIASVETKKKRDDIPCRRSIYLRSGQRRMSAIRLISGFLAGPPCAQRTIGAI